MISNEFIFDYLKYETLRAELNYGVSKEKSQMLWDEQFQVPNMAKIGVISMLLSEVVH